MEQKRQIESMGALMLAAFIWGIAFVAQSVGMNYVGPFTFNCVRSLLGALVLVPCIFLLKALKSKEEKEVIKAMTEEEKKQERKNLLLGGLTCGVFLAIASALQQVGILMTTVGKAGFITAMYIILVPIFSIALKKKTGINLWISVVLAVIGMYFLCMTESFTIQTGDFLLILCAVFFSFQILAVDHFSKKVEGVKLSCAQFFVSGLLCVIPMLVLDGMFFAKAPQIMSIFAAWKPIAYAGILSCGVAYTLQIIGQKHANPTAASLVMSLESVFSVLAGFVLLGQKMSGRELMGCIIMFLAIIIAQIPVKKA